MLLWDPVAEHHSAGPVFTPISSSFSSGAVGKQQAAFPPHPCNFWHVGQDLGKELQTRARNRPPEFGQPAYLNQKVWEAWYREILASKKQLHNGLKAAWTLKLPFLKVSIISCFIKVLTWKWACRNCLTFLTLAPLQGPQYRYMKEQREQQTLVDLLLVFRQYLNARFLVLPEYVLWTYYKHETWTSFGLYT